MTEHQLHLLQSRAEERPPNSLGGVGLGKEGGGATSSLRMGESGGRRCSGFCSGFVQKGKKQQAACSSQVEAGEGTGGSTLATSTHSRPKMERGKVGSHLGP